MQANRSNPLAQQTPNQEFTLAESLLLARKRRVLILSLTFGAMLIAVLLGYYRGKRYTATGQLEIQPGSASALKVSLASAIGSGMGSLDSVIESDIRVLTSETILIEVARTLKLQDNPVFLGGVTKIRTARFGGREIALLHGDLNDPYVRSKVLTIMKAHVTVAREPRTQMINISYESKSPELSASIVNTLESAYIEQNFLNHYDRTKQVTKWLAQQIDDLRSVVQSSQDRMVDLQKKLGISTLDPQHSLVVSEISELERGLSTATQERILSEARYRAMLAMPRDQILDAPSVAGSEGPQPMLSSMRAQRTALETQLSSLEQIYGPKYPQVKQLRAQLAALDKAIDKEQTRVIAEAKNAYEISLEAQTKAKGLLDSRVQEIYGQRDDLVQYDLMSQDYESNRKMYESILSRLREAAVDAGLDSADVSVVDMASLPVEPSSMSLGKLALIGLFMGAFASFAISLVLERMDTRLRDSRQIQEVLGLPAITVVPQTSWKGDRTKEAEEDKAQGPEILYDSRSAFAEAVRTLRTSIQLSGNSRQSRVITFTSCQPGEGKSTISSNLAAALAQGGKRVIVVDTDMRRPSLMWRFKLAGKKGLSEYLTGLEPLENVIQQHAVLPALHLLPSGSVPPLPADLLASDQMRNLVKELRGRYDYVLLDTPPVLSVTDPLLVSSLADGIVLVIRQGSCTRAMLARAAELFREVGTKLYGFALNGVDASLPEYYGYLGYYSYDYKSNE